MTEDTHRQVALERVANNGHPTGRGTYDVVVVGGGHNGLTAASYLAGAGLSVAVLERLDHVGGAAISAQAFPGFPTRLSRYSYLADPRVAFAGTLHLGEDYTALERAYTEAASGHVPSRVPREVYCHTLTDPSILGRVPDGTQTLTYFGLHLPATLFDDPATRAERKELAVTRAIASLNEHLLDPIESVVARDAAGRPRIEAKIPQDIEADLGMPGGHIFHGDLAWPWAADTALLDTPAARWGVETGRESILLCGSGARRGGAVSGLGGHNAAQSVLELA